MEHYSADDVKKAINGFLLEQLNKKLEPEKKNLAKAKSVSDDDKIAEITVVISVLKAKYTLSEWMADAATRMASQLKFGTHISKGVHPGSKGDNVNFNHEVELPLGIVGSQTPITLELDANGNAAALPLAAFFNTPVGGEEGVKLRDLILTDHPALAAAFASSATLSEAYTQQFKMALINPITSPTTHEKNKQILWPRSNDSIVDDNYIGLIPLYPSSLTHCVYHTINGSRYSDANKQARDNRNKKTVEQQAYVSINNLAVVRLGGKKPQNISKLTSGQGGKNYLMPSLPPQIKQNEVFSLGLRQESIFGRGLRRKCYFALEELFTVVQYDKNTQLQRNQRQHALDQMLIIVLSIADSLQQQAKGWSQNSQLDMDEKYWLDPYRDDNEFVTKRQDADWLLAIEHKFASWLNNILKKKFPKKRMQFGDAEYEQWLKSIRHVIKANQRNNQGEFA
jgi:CRISPR-associated protein Csy1